MLFRCQDTRVDILTIFHNGRELVGPYLESVGRLTVPFTLYLLDNGSRDGTGDRIGRRLGDLRFPVRFFRSVRNHGFARGMNLLAAQGSADYILALNPDTEIEPDCLAHLLARAEADPRIGVCEARQTPLEHPKYVDPETGETSWCSGAAALIRRQAFDAVGGFDAELFFMYCEDVDFSWKLWLNGWRCVYVPDARVRHNTGQTVPGRRRALENYFSFRNSLFLCHRFGQSDAVRMAGSFLWKRFGSRRYSLKSKALFAIAFADHIRYIPYLIRTRRKWGSRGHPWVRLSETSLSE